MMTWSKAILFAGTLLCSGLLLSCGTTNPDKVASVLGIDAEGAAQIAGRLPTGPLAVYQIMRDAKRRYGEFLRNTSTGTLALLTPDNLNYFVLEPGQVNEISRQQLGKYDSATFIVNHRRTDAPAGQPSFLALTIIRVFSLGTYPSDRVVAVRNPEWYDRHTCHKKLLALPGTEIAETVASFERMHEVAETSNSDPGTLKEWHATVTECTAGNAMTDSWKYPKPWQHIIDNKSFADDKRRLGFSPDAELGYSVEARLIRFEQTSDTKSSLPLWFSIGKPFSHEALIVTMRSPVDETSYAGTYYLRFARN